MIHVDSFLNRVPNRHYKCFDFAREVWATSFGIDPGKQLDELQAMLADGKLTASRMHAIVKLAKPIDPCFVVFQRKRTTPHIGILYHGRLLHLAATGAEYTRIHFIAARYARMSYYLCQQQ